MDNHSDDKEILYPFSLSRKCKDTQADWDAEQDGIRVDNNISEWNMPTGLENSQDE